MISSVRLDGPNACMTIDGATNPEIFEAFVREILVPILRPGDIVVMDNPGAHKNEATLALIRALGAQTRFLPAYSPNLNSIRNPDLLRAIERSLAAVFASDASELVYRLRLHFY